MKIKILGSAAAECIPALWCECPTCQYARKHGGKDVRRRTSYLIDDDTMVDYGPDAFWQVTEFNIDLRKIEHIFFTHSHEDHLNPTDLEWRRDGFSSVSKMLHIYGDEEIRNRLLRDWEACCHRELPFSELRMEYHAMLPGDVVHTGGLEVLALPADHTHYETPLLYRMTRGGKTVLIANDTGMLPDRAWELLAGRRLDAVIIDCTGGIHPQYGHNQVNHLGAFTDVAIRQRFIAMNVLTPEAPFVLNHFSHNAQSLHEEMTARMAPEGILVGFDGMELDLR